MDQFSTVNVGARRWITNGPEGAAQHPHAANDRHLSGLMQAAQDGDRGAYAALLEQLLPNSAALHSKSSSLLPVVGCRRHCPGHINVIARRTRYI